MRHFWNRQRGDDEIERRLADERPQASDELVRRISEQVDSSSAPVGVGRVRMGFAATVTAAALAAVIALGGLGGTIDAATDAIQTDNASHKSSHEKPANDQYDEKVTICHRPPGTPTNGQTLRVSRSAADAHLRNHSLDSEGACPS